MHYKTKIISWVRWVTPSRGLAQSRQSAVWLSVSPHLAECWQQHHGVNTWPTTDNLLLPSVEKVYQDFTEFEYIRQSGQKLSVWSLMLPFNLSTGRQGSWLQQAEGWRLHLKYSWLRSYYSYLQVFWEMQKNQALHCFSNWKWLPYNLQHVNSSNAKKCLFNKHFSPLSPGFENHVQKCYIHLQLQWSS